MAETKVTLENLKELQSAIKSEFLDRYYSKAYEIHKIKSTTVLQGSTPSKELSKLSQLIRSHATKIGIILKPDTFTEKNYPATYQELKALIDTVFYLFSILPLFYNDKDQFTKLFLEQLDDALFKLLHSLQELCKELDGKFADEKYDQERLTCIGMMWDACDEFDSIVKNGVFGALVDDMKTTIHIIDEVIGEVDIFIMDPAEHIGEALFSLNEDFNDIDESDVFDINGNWKETDDSEKIEKVVKLVLPVMKKWRIKANLIKTLFKTLRAFFSAKTKPKIFTVAQLNEIDKWANDIAAEADSFTCTIYMADETFTDKDAQEEMNEVNKYVKKLLAVLKKVKKNPDDKNEFLTVWEKKYFS